MELELGASGSSLPGLVSLLLWVFPKPVLQSPGPFASVRAVRIVDAVLGNQKSLHDLAAPEVSLNDFVHIRQLDTSVPDGVRIDDDAGAVFALVQAATAIGPHRSTKASSSQSFLEGGAKKLRALGVAATPRMAVGTLVSADEKMMSVLGHTNARCNGRQGSPDVLKDFIVRVRSQSVETQEP